MPEKFCKILHVFKTESIRPSYVIEMQSYSAVLGKYVISDMYQNMLDYVRAGNSLDDLDFCWHE